VAASLRSKVLDAEIGDDEKESSVSILAMVMGVESHVATKRQDRDKAEKRERGFLMLTAARISPFLPDPPDADG
jgi:hypothetical protein